MSRLSLSIKAWWTPKGGYESSEYEDAYHIGEAADDAPLRVAVADGATGATFSGLWAGILAGDYANGRLSRDTLVQRLPLLARDWTRQVEAMQLPWYAAAKVNQEGSHAALIGLTIFPASGRYDSVSYGDCALFHLRPALSDATKYSLVSSFPYTRWEDFGGTPILLGTKPVSDGNLQTHCVVQSGQIQRGDVMYVMSDALAAWFLREIYKERSPWEWLKPLDLPDGSQTLATMVRDLRDSHRLKNDDVTVVSIRCE